MSETARLLFPALRWRDDGGFAHEAAAIADALALGVGGFCVFGGAAADVAALTDSLRARSAVPLLIASDLERGAGQQFTGATQLPPLAAIGALDDLAVTRRAGDLTAREALAVGVDWIYAPVADVDLEPRNPIVGTRAFGSEPAHVARHVAAWVEGCRAAGALCCAKHFPGHGRTVEDSHAALPRVADARTALEADLDPFRAAIAAGVDALMTAHVVYDALDDGTAATLSRPILDGLARSELGFDGLIVSDALNMAGVLRAAEQGTEAAAGIAALDAGCDALLYPDDPGAVHRALVAAAGDTERAARIRASHQRIDAAARRAAPRPDGGGAWGRAEDVAWADDIALRSLVTTRGAPAAGAACDIVTIDDDKGGPFAPPPRDTFPAVLRAAGIDAREAAAPSGQRALVIAVYSDVRAWKVSRELSAQGREALAAALAADAAATIVFFGHPRDAAALPGAHVLTAWGGEAVMQRAAARRLAGAR